MYVKRWYRAVFPNFILLFFLFSLVELYVIFTKDYTIKKIYTTKKGEEIIKEYHNTTANEK